MGQRGDCRSILQSRGTREVLRLKSPRKRWFAWSLVRSGRVTRWANGERGDFIARPRHSLLGHDLAELRQAYHALGASVAGFEVAELLSSVGHLSNDDLANAHNCDWGHPRAVSMRLVSVLPTCLKVLGLPRFLRFISRTPEQPAVAYELHRPDVGITCRRPDRRDQARGHGPAFRRHREIA